MGVQRATWFEELGIEHHCSLLTATEARRGEADGVVYRYEASKTL